MNLRIILFEVCPSSLQIRNEEDELLIHLQDLVATSTIFIMYYRHSIVNEILLPLSEEEGMYPIYVCRIYVSCVFDISIRYTF